MIDVGDGLSRDECALQALDRPDFGKRRAGLNRDADADLGEVDATALGELPFGNELVDYGRSDDRDIDRLAANDALLEAARGVVHNTLGLGENIPISTANLNDGFVALKDGQMVMLRIPYPLSFFAKGLDGRIDDPNAGWKGRGLWSTNGDRTPWLKEGGKGSRPRAVHIQVRPDPLAH